MGLLSKLIKHTVKLPINVASDILTCGGELADKESALKRQLQEFEEDMNNPEDN